ncbi:MAG: DAK2 domain-containing protein [Chloroflexota bacterium]
MTDTDAIVGQCLEAALAIIQEKEEELHKLDAVAGDGDHGAGMVRGLKAAVLVDYTGTGGDVLAKAGSEFSNAAGGASGALVGMFMMTLGNGLKTETPDAEMVGGALSQALGMLKQMGKSDVGDKTMIDTIDPFVNAYQEAAAAGASITGAWQAALPAAASGRETTVDMIASKGRSAVLKEKSRGAADPGATSMLYIFQAVGDVLSEACPET